MKRRRLKSTGRIKFVLSSAGEKFIDEEMEWLSLTPGQRILETTKLWKLYMALGGNLDP